MEIPGKTPLVAHEVYNHYRDDGHAGSSRKPGEAAARDDRVAFSGDANKIREAIQAISRMPDVREDKVAAMKRRIEAGTYRIAGDQIASQLIGEALENNDILDQIDPRRD